MAKKKVAKKATKGAAVKKSAAKPAAQKTAPKTSTKAKKATPKKAAVKPAKKAAAKPAKKAGASKSAPEGGLSLQDVRTALDNVTRAKNTFESFEGKTEAEIDAYFNALDKARLEAWALIHKALPQLIEQLVYNEMLECYYTDPEAGTIRYIASELGWDDVVGQYILVGQAGDVWEGSGKIGELVSPLETQPA